jgi:hypothetical protein
VALNIADKETEALVAQTGRRPRSAEEMRTWLETEIWPLFPDETLDREPMTKAEREELLGFGPDGF